MSRTPTSKAKEWETKAKLVIERKEYYEAIECLAVAISYTPNMFNLWKAQADLSMEVKEYSAAQRSATRCVDLEPNNTAGLLLLCKASLHRMNNVVAEQAFERLHALDPVSYPPTIFQRLRNVARMSFSGRSPAIRPPFVCDEKLMITTWAINNWWEKPTSTGNSLPFFTQQMEQLRGWLKVAPTDSQKSYKIYQTVGFSKGINILRGRSIYAHPYFANDPNDPNAAKRTLEWCDIVECVPEVLLWAEDIHVHLVISRLGDVGGLTKYQEVEISGLHGGNKLTLKDSRIATKTLLRRAWDEALRVKEMNPLVLILYSPIEDRLSAKRKLDSTKGHQFLESFVKLCVTMNTTNFSGFWRATWELSQIQFNKGLRTQAKASYRLLLATKIDYDHPTDNDRVMLAIALVHNYLGQVHQDNNEYNDAWREYQESLRISYEHYVTEITGETQSLLLERVCALFLETKWHTLRWRVQTATKFVIYLMQNRSLIPTMKFSFDTEFWLPILQKLGWVTTGRAVAPVPASMESVAEERAKSARAAACFYCFQRSPIFRVCSRCMKVGYCGPECQKKDWPKHKLICSNQDNK